MNDVTVGVRRFVRETDDAMVVETSNGRELAIPYEEVSQIHRCTPPWVKISASFADREHLL